MPRQSPQDGDLLLVEAGSRILELWQPAQDRILFSEANLASCALRDSHSSQQITQFPSEDSHSQQSPISRLWPVLKGLLHISGVSWLDPW